MAYLLGLVALLGASMLPALLPPAPTRCKGDDERWSAIHAARLAGGYQREKLRDAKAFFALLRPDNPVSDLRDFFSRWAERDKRGEGVASHKSPGRPAKISRKLALTIATDWTQKGVGTGARHRPYRRMEEVRLGRDVSLGITAAGGCRHSRSYPLSPPCYAQQAPTWAPIPAGNGEAP